MSTDLTAGQIADIVRMLTVQDVNYMAEICHTYSTPIWDFLGWRYGRLEAQKGALGRYTEMWALFELGRGVSE